MYQELKSEWLKCLKNWTISIGSYKVWNSSTASRVEMHNYLIYF